MRLKIAILALLTQLVIAAGVYSYGGEPFAFLKLGIGPRATGMGGAFTSVADDASAIYYNPAGTVTLSGMDLMAETYMLSMGRSLNYLATAKPFAVNKATYSVGFAWINYSAGSDIEKRLTDSPDPDSVFSDAANIFIFNISTTLSDRLYLGGNFKFFYETIDVNKGIGVGFDIGAMAKFTDTLKAGISISNVSANLSWTNNSLQESLPTSAAAGLSDLFRNIFGAQGLNLLLSGDLVYNTFSGVFAKAGGELSVNDFFYLRSGYGDSFTLGAGLKLKPSDALSIRVDYAFLSDTIEPGAFNHRIGLLVTYLFPRSGVETKQEAAPVSTQKPPADKYDW
jgi:hypothetical protein